MTSIPALKEWAAICHALLAGEQIIDLRKGGLREESLSGDGRHFGVDSTHAWLYPTVEHQKAELLKPAYRHWIDLAPNAPVGHTIRVHGYVEIVETITITEPAELAAITTRVIWSDEYAASRMKWKHRDPLWVLILRAHRLARPLDIAWNDEYGGCKSWVNFIDAPTDLTTLESEPALSDAVFDARVKGVREALQTAATSTA